MSSPATDTPATQDRLDPDVCVARVAFTSTIDNDTIDVTGEIVRSPKPSTPA